MKTSAQLVDKMFTFSRCMREKMGVKSNISHLSMVQVQTLVFIKKHPASPMRSIAEFLQVELPSATNLIENLVKAGLVSRSADKKDKRLVKISLTQKGKILLEKAKKEKQESMEKILSFLPDADKKQLLVILTKLTDTIERQNEK